MQPITTANQATQDLTVGHGFRRHSTHGSLRAERSHSTQTAR
jgi:hypothetical protein